MDRSLCSCQYERHAGTVRADVSGQRPKRITFSSGASTSPTGIQTGQQVAFLATAEASAAYVMNADVQSDKIDLADKGYVIDPAWSPNGQCWRSVAPAQRELRSLLMEIASRH